MIFGVKKSLKIPKGQPVFVNQRSTKHTYKTKDRVTRTPREVIRFVVPVMHEKRPYGTSCLTLCHSRAAREESYGSFCLTF